MKNNYIVVDYWKDNFNNFGDQLNPYIIEKLSGKKVTTDTNKGYVAYTCIGSLLQKKFKYPVQVWGTGCMYRNRKVSNIDRIHAIRGKLSEKIVRLHGIDCPYTYGDPAILLPFFYKPKSRNKKYTIGVIPHYVDHQSEWVNKYRNGQDVKLINILDDVEKVIDEINECCYIISSSLHGIIAADAYGIPSLWVEFSDNVRGNGFKFYDYFSGMDQESYNPIQLRSNSVSIYEVEKHIKRDRKITIGQQRKLFDACPFNYNNLQV